MPCGVDRTRNVSQFSSADTQTNKSNAIKDLNSVSNWFHERWLCTGVHTGPNLGARSRVGKADCSKIYSEKISGAKCDRPELQRLLKRWSLGLWSL